MSESAIETNIEEIARRLATQVDQGQRAVLFLGSRAGGLFGNEFLYETLKNFSLLNFDTLSNVEKFRECYYVLKHFTESERHNILVGALATLRCREEDKLIAKLVKVGFFEAIVSTNIDTFLEDACSSLGLLEPDDYRVFIPGRDKITEIEQNRPRYSPIIKVFGDLNSLRYSTPGKEFNLQAEPELQKFLTSILTRDIFLDGYDPVWDHTIEQAFPQGGGNAWYLNETELTQQAYLTSVFNERNGIFIQEDKGSFSNFLRALHDRLGEGIKQQEVATSPFLLQPQSPDQERKRIFISYSKQDRPYLERLTTHLKGYLLKDTVAIWDDTKILPGTNWMKEIEKALVHAKVAVLLVSSNFLSSDSKNEIPILLEAARSRKLQLLPIIIDPSASLFNEHEPLNPYQTVNSSSKPLRWMEPYEQEVMWDKLAKQVYSILHSQK